MLKRSRKLQKGVSTVELMVSSVIGLFLVASIASYLLINLKANKDNISQVKLNQELRSTMDLISRDIRRAGFYEGASDSRGFSKIFSPSNDCIVYRYDRNRNDTLENDETNGFLYINSTKTLYMRQPIATDTDCTGGYGTSFTSAWLAINSAANVEITDFKICNAASQPPSSCNPLVPGKLKQILLYLEGRLSGQEDSKMSLIETIQLPNVPNL